MNILHVHAIGHGEAGYFNVVSLHVDDVPLVGLLVAGGGRGGAGRFVTMPAGGEEGGEANLQRPMASQLNGHLRVGRVG